MGNGALQKVRRTRIERGKPAFAILMSCDDNRRDFADARHHPDFPDKFSTIHLRHTVVNHHQIRLVVTQPMQRLHRVSISDGGIFFPHQRHKLSINPQVRWPVIDYQNARVHSVMDYRPMFKIRLTPDYEFISLLFNGLPDIRHCWE